MTETDAQLLEAAAKAAGLDYGVIHQRPHRSCPEGWTPWNPLTDDGDALRLAVALRMTIDYNGSGVFAGSNAPEPHHAYADEIGHDAAATRRAIVRAAAALVRA